MDIEGLLGNPMLQVGLGILANNNQRGQFAPAFGAGMQQGLNNVTAYRQQQQMNDLRQQQIDNQKYLFDVQKQKVDQENAQRVAEQQAIAEAQKLRPDLAPLFAIDPKSAMKALYPQAGGSDPYYTPIATENGLVSFDNRSGKINPLDLNGRPLIKSTDSPIVRGAVKGAESQASANWKPNTDIDGQVYTDAQVAQMARGGFNTPYPITWNGQPMGAEGTTATDRQEGINSPADISVGNPRGGIRVPTKAEQAAQVEQAKADVGMATDSKKNVKKANQFMSVAQQAKAILDNPTAKPTSSGVGALVDSAGGFLGIAPEGAKEAAQLKSLSGWLVSNVPRMEGPQSNFDVENYQTMAGLVGDRTQPLEVRKAALDQVMQLQEKYKALNEESSIMPKNEPMPQPSKVFDAMPKPNQYKGKIIRDDTTGKRYQSNGLQWKEVK